MKQNFQWNGVSFPFSALESETMRKFEAEKEKVVKALEAYEEEAGINETLNADGVIAECHIMDLFFDAILGKGASEKMFQGYDIGERVKASKKLGRLYRRQTEEYNQSVSEGIFG